MTTPQTKAPEALSRRDAARARVVYALVEIEEAQTRLMRAAQALSSIVGLASENSACMKVSERAKKLWYRLEHHAGALERRGGPLLDHELADARQLLYEAEWVAFRTDGKPCADGRAMP